MIFDTIDNLNKYKGIYCNLDKTIEYIENNELDTLKEGKNIIYEDEVYANVIKQSLSSDVYKDYEYHRQFLDLHIILQGEEKILFSSNIIEETVEYQELNDYGMVNTKADCECVLDKGKFAICMLGELHKPCVGNEGTVKKVVFKIFIG